MAIFFRSTGWIGPLISGKPEALKPGHEAWPGL